MFMSLRFLTCTTEMITVISQICHEGQIRGCVVSTPKTGRVR